MQGNHKSLKNIAIMLVVRNLGLIEQIANGNIMFYLLLVKMVRQLCGFATNLL